MKAVANCSTGKGAILFLNHILPNLSEGVNMEERVSKSKFKPRALEYFREVERTGKQLIITDRGKPVIKIIPYSEGPDKEMEALRGTVVKYDLPTEPVGLEDWESLP